MKKQLRKIAKQIALEKGVSYSCDVKSRVKKIAKNILSYSDWYKKYSYLYKANHKIKYMRYYEQFIRNNYEN